MSTTVFSRIMDMDLSILNTNLNIFGYNIRLISFICFELVLSICLWAIFELFTRR